MGKETFPGNYNERTSVHNTPLPHNNLKVVKGDTVPVSFEFDAWVSIREQYIERWIFGCKSKNPNSFTSRGQPAIISFVCQQQFPDLRIATDQNSLKNKKSYENCN